MSMDDVKWYFAIWGRTGHAYRGEGAKISVCGMGREPLIPSGRSRRCRRCTRILGDL